MKIRIIASVSIIVVSLFHVFASAQMYEVFFDNTDADVNIIGDWVEYALPNSFGSNTIHTKPAGSGEAYVRYPMPGGASMQSGRYAIYARWVSNSACATNVKYRIFYSPGAYTDVYINQQINSSRWICLGTLDIQHPRPIIRIYDDANGYVVADGIRFLRVGDLPSSMKMNPRIYDHGNIVDCDDGF
ncbi:MAG: hypothetical protein JW795_13915 [Chitinivibrionales bacterium]|nr:hypothetical protein [Chitinivibrionales bacterium]